MLEDGRTVTADENYVRESILQPEAKIVKGFKPVMPTFQGLVNEEQVNALVAYIKSMSGKQEGEKTNASVDAPRRSEQAQAQVQRSQVQ